MRAFFDLSHEPMCIVGRSGRIEEANPAFAALGRADAIGRPLVDFVDPDDHPAMTRAIEAVLAGARSVSVDGRSASRRLSWSLTSGAEGRRIFAVVHATDTTSLEERLARKSAEFEAVLLALHDLYFRLDASGRIVDWHAGRESDLHVAPSAFLGRRPQDVLPPDVGAQIAVAIERTRDTQEAQSIAYSLSTPGGVGRFEARLVPLVEDQVIAVIRNTTARHRAEEALRESEERLRASQKMEAIGRLAAGVAHDFNNVLSVILGRVSILMRLLSPPLHAHAAEISDAAARAAALTRQLLAFGRKQVLNPTVLDVDAVIAQMSGMLQPMIGEQITLTTISSGEALANADRGQLEQVIMNLVINARDAIDGRGAIEIATRSAHIDEAAASRRDGASVGDHVVISVTDGGSGIAPDVMEHLFEPFFTTKPRGKGTGLGLAMVYGIVQQSGGHIVVTSGEGEGTRFEVFLPRAKGPAAPPEPAHENGERPLPRGTEGVLVVEDEDGIRRLMVEILRGCGYAVKAARDAEQALEILRSSREPIALLLTDVVMPGLGGRELARAARESHPDVRVLLTSGYDDTLGDDEHLPFLAKPFDAMALAVSVRDVIDGKSGK